MIKPPLLFVWLFIFAFGSGCATSKGSSTLYYSNGIYRVVVQYRLQQERSMAAEYLYRQARNVCGNDNFWFQVVPFDNNTFVGFFKCGVVR
jgi:hypothetical protein